MKAVLLVALLVAAASAQNETNATAPETGTPEMPLPNQPLPGEPMPGTSIPAGVLSVYAQQQYSSTYATSLLELQAAYVWITASEGMEKMAIVGAGSGGFSDPVFGLEEQAANIEKKADSKHSDRTSFLEVEEEAFNGPIEDLNFGVDSMDELIEAQTETALLQLTKLMYVQAAHRLGSNQERHYQIQAVLGQLNAMAGFSQPLQQIMHLLYYRDMVELVTTVVTIQKQDSWTLWVFNEMLETELWDNEEMPMGFQQRLAASRLQAMGQFQMQAQLELVGLVMDMYMQQLVGGMAAQSGQMHMMQSPADQTMGSSFLEMETQFVPSMALGGIFGWEAFLPYVKFYTAWIKYQASSMLAMVAQVDAMALAGDDKGQAEHTPMLMAHQITPLLKQWCQLRLMLALYDFYKLNGAISPIGAHHGYMHANAANAHAGANAAAFNNLMQTAQAVEEAPAAEEAAPAADKVVEEPVNAQAPAPKPEAAPVLAEAAKLAVAEEEAPKMSSTQMATAEPVEKVETAVAAETEQEPSVVGL